MGEHPDLIVGFQGSDDAGVYRVSPDLALILTVDFFTPIVDDPFVFGQVAAANALSDVYAMGGEPKAALNLVAFPLESMDIQVLHRILEGGLERMKTAGVALAGGHSVEDGELKYGLSVTGFVHPDKILTNRGIQPGDALVLTKPIGTGVLGTAVKAGLAPPEGEEAMTANMVALNDTAARTARDFPIHACTDVTGYGLLGHLAEMTGSGDITVEIDAGAVPFLPGARDAAAMGLVPAGARNNRLFREAEVAVPPGVDPVMVDLLFDPQTSGGLLLALPGAEAAALVTRLAAAGVAAAVVGRAGPRTDRPIRVVNP